MKKTYLILLLSCMFHQMAFSQTELGIKAGTNFTNISPQDIPENTFSFKHDIRLSYHIGVFGTLDLNKKLSASADLLYSNKGFTTDGVSGEEAKIHFHYINLPILVNYAITQRLKFGVGPELGYLLSARSKFDDQNVNVDIIYKNNFDVGIDAGLECSVNELLNVGLRYNYGLSSVWGNDIQITDQQGFLIDANPKIQNRVLQLYVGYKLKKS